MKKVINKKIILLVFVDNKKNIVKRDSECMSYDKKK